MATRAIAIEDVKTGEITEAVYEHPFCGSPLPLGECQSRCLCWSAADCRSFAPSPVSGQRSRRKI